MKSLITGFFGLLFISFIDAAGTRRIINEEMNALERVQAAIKDCGQLCALSDYHSTIYNAQKCPDDYTKLMDIAYFAIMNPKAEQENVFISYNCLLPILMDADSIPVRVIINRFRSDQWSLVYFFYNQKISVVRFQPDRSLVSGGIFRTPLSKEAIALRMHFTQFLKTQKFAFGSQASQYILQAAR